MDIKDRMSVSLSANQVQKLIGPDSRIVLYPDLNNVSNIDQAFGQHHKLIVLYLNQLQDGVATGHWVLLLRSRKGKKRIIEYYDPYGKFIDEPLEWLDHEQAESLGQGTNRLCHLLYDFSGEPNTEVHYNEFPLQKSKEGINTCGRWTALRGRFHRISLKTFQSIMKKLDQEGYDLDKLVTLLTDQLYGGEIHQE